MTCQRTYATLCLLEFNVLPALYPGKETVPIYGHGDTQRPGCGFRHYLSMDVTHAHTSHSVSLNFSTFITSGAGRHGDRHENNSKSLTGRTDFQLKITMMLFKQNFRVKYSLFFIFSPQFTIIENSSKEQINTTGTMGKCINLCIHYYTNIIIISCINTPFYIK